MRNHSIVFVALDVHQKSIVASYAAMLRARPVAQPSGCGHELTPSLLPFR